MWLKLCHWEVPAEGGWRFGPASRKVDNGGIWMLELGTRSRLGPGCSGRRPRNNFSGCPIG